MSNAVFTLPSTLVDDLTEEYEYSIIGDPFVIDERCGSCLVPVRRADGSVGFAYCAGRDFLDYFAVADLQRIKEIDLFPYLAKKDFVK